MPVGYQRLRGLLFCTLIIGRGKASVKSKSKKKPVKARKIPDMREGKSSTDAFATAMGQILNPLPSPKKRSSS